MEILTIIKNTGLIIISYLLGAIPFCYIIGKIHSRKDLTKIGDRNPGGWNLIFNVSKSWGIVGSLLDFFKGFFAYFISYRLSNMQLIAILAGCAAVAGHNYSPYLKFSGGKGLATALGVLMATNFYSLVPFAIGIILVLFLLKNMIWGVISGVLSSGIFLYILNRSGIFIIFVILLLIIIIPKYTLLSKSFLDGFKIKRGTRLKDLFTPKIR